MKYDYLCCETGKIYEVSHSMAQDAFTKLQELVDLVGGVDKMVLSTDFEQDPPTEQDFSDSYTVERVVSGGTGTIFKGMGWPTSDTKHMSYTGKHKKKVEALREQRAKRVSAGLSVADVAQQAGLTGVTDSVVNNNKWDKLSKEQKETAASHGIRPSKDFTN